MTTKPQSDIRVVEASCHLSTIQRCKHWAAHYHLQCRLSSRKMWIQFAVGYIFLSLWLYWTKFEPKYSARYTDALTTRLYHLVGIFISSTPGSRIARHCSQEQRNISSVYYSLMKLYCYSATQQRWSPWGRHWSRGHILKSLAWKPQVLKKCLSSARGQQYFLNC